MQRKSQVEVQINTRDEKGFVHEGTENIVLDVYDLTEWRVKRASNEKVDKEYILNTYSTKEKLDNFVKSEQMKKITETPLLIRRYGQCKRLLCHAIKNEQNAAYLILSSGETGKYHMLPNRCLFTTIAGRHRDRIHKFAL